MTAPTLEFTLPPSLEAHEPPEVRGLGRDGVRLLVGSGSDRVSHHRFVDLPELLRPGDLLVVNTSATLPAAVPVLGRDLAVHFSTEAPGASAAGASAAGASALGADDASVAWIVELRRSDATANAPYLSGAVGERYELAGSAVVELVAPYSAGRLWVASVRLPSPGLAAYLRRHGAPIRYQYVSRPWPLSAYQTIFGREPGSAEMPSAGRPFTERMVTRLVASGVLVAPVLLHTGVASPEAHERPYPERFAVPPATAGVVNLTRAQGGRVVAVGTTVVRALESAVDDSGRVRPSQGFTSLVVDEARGVRVVDGLLTGFHEPRASHLDLLAAVAGKDLLARCYEEAVREGYLWHEFGDLNLLLP